MVLDLCLNFAIYMYKSQAFWHAEIKESLDLLKKCLANMQNDNHYTF